MGIQVSRSTISEQRECFTLFKRRALNCKIKITIKEGRLVRQFLERSYVKPHKNGIEMIQRKLACGNNASTPVTDQNVTAEQVIDISTLLEKISEQKQKVMIRGEVNQFLNDPERKRLSLQEANIDPVQVLMVILKDYPSFHALLDPNQIGDAGTQALEETLTINQSMQQLKVASNQIGAKVQEALRQAIATHHPSRELCT